MTERIELKYRAIKFPDFCPVCEEPATTEGTIPAFTRAQREEAKNLDKWAFTSSRVVASTASMPVAGPSYLVIPVCEQHQFSFQETKHLRGIMPILSGLLFLSAVVLALILLAGVISSSSINTQVLFFLALSIIGFVFTYKLGGLSALERVVSVFDISSDMSTVVLNISNRRYADNLLELNPMSAKRLKKL